MKRKLLIGLFGFFFIVGACNALAKKSETHATVDVVKATSTVQVTASKTIEATTQIVATATAVATNTVEFTKTVTNVPTKVIATATVVVQTKQQSTAKPVQATKVVVEDKSAYPCKTGQIKGSVNGKYHVPGGRDYKRTKNAVCFDTVDQAVAAGYVAAANP